jgi:hypothetical protein
MAIRKDGDQITVIDFSDCDIVMGSGIEDPKQLFTNTLNFFQSEEVITDHNYNEVVSKFTNVNLSGIPGNKVILRFTRPESITKLIQLLSQLQEDVFRHQEWMENPD